MMNYKQNKTIYKKIKRKKIEIKNVCEVGVYLPETSNIIDFIFEGKNSTLVEPNPPAIEAINTFFKEFKNIQLYPFAIYNYNGKLVLSNAEASTFVSELPASPALTNDNYKINVSKNVEVECRLFSEIDKGNFDLLSVDTEGCEWYVLETMKSRPKVISIETHGKFYINPFMDKIINWINENDYKVWYKDKSDTVYFKNGLFKSTLIEKLWLLIVNIRIKLRKAKRFLYKRKSNS
jgi:FkbM family methyltransferase